MPLSDFLKKNHLCPVCLLKKAMAATQVHVDGAKQFSNGAAKTPPMGWASWNLFRHNINETLIEEIARAMKAARLDECGYTYVNVDDCWMASARDADGRLQSDPVAFPSGIRALAEKVNAAGFKLGIYTSNGTLTCEDLPSSLYHERTDAETFAEWGVEYFKYDFCHNEAIPTAAPELEKITVTRQGETGGDVYFAFEADLRGGAEVLTDEKLTETGKYVTGLDAGGGMIVFDHVNAPEEGDYILTLGLRKSGLFEKFAEIVVNGADVYTVRVPATKGFTREGRAQVTVRLREGQNFILLHNPIGSRMDSAARQYRDMGSELTRATKKVAEERGEPEKPICYSICEWGLNRPWKWGATAGNLWRTTPDIKPFWASIVGIYEANVRLAAYAGPGHWNDPDMLEVGNGSLTDRENIAHFTLWCMMAAPLILGNDVRQFIREDGTVDTENKIWKIVTNPDAIAIDQDPRGLQCRRVKTTGLTDVLVKPMADNEIAVCLFNKGPKAMEAGFSLKELTEMADVTLPKAESYRVRNIWERTEFIAKDRIAQSVEPHSVILYRIKEKQS